MKTTYPLISCVCITHNSPENLKKAIACFESQNYPNKELVISFPKNDHLSQQIITRALTDSELRIYPIQRHPEVSAAEAKHEAVVKSAGDYICMWDDDDWHHASRLTYQFNSMQSLGYGYKASVFTRVFLYDFNTQKAYLSFPHTWDESILCRRELLMEKQYLAEDNVQVVRALSEKKLLWRISDAPFLYIYVDHGHDDWNESRFGNVLEKSELLNEEVTRNIRSLVG